MMWAATVRRCPTGGSRHPSQFGARMQLARALNHAPYLICDGMHDSQSPGQHAYDSSAAAERLRGDYFIVPHEHSESNLTADSVCSGDQRVRSFVPCYHSRGSLTTCGEHGGPGDPAGFRRNSLGNNLPQGMSPVRHNTRNLSGAGSNTDVRVELPYSRREFRSEDYLNGQHVVRRYENLNLSRSDARGDDDNVVSLSYQQQSLGGSTIYDQEIWGNDLFMDCWDNRRFLIEKGVYREAVKFLCVLALSLTLIFFVIIGFGVHNILVTVIFLVMLLSTVLMAIFLLMRKPACSSCTESIDIPGHTSIPSHRRCPSYISDVNGVIKKNLADSPPPYEFPPEYESLPPELLVSAISLQEINSLPDSASHRATNKLNSTQLAARRFLFPSSRETIAKEPSSTNHSSVGSLAQEHKPSGESSTTAVTAGSDRSDKPSKDTDKSLPTYDCVIKINDKTNTSPSKTKT